MMRLLIVMMLLLVSGCAAKVHQVPEEYRPLERIKESVLRPGTLITTIGTTARVWDLDKWLAEHPPGGTLYHALLLHEREHTVRQLAYGLKKWLGRYLTDTEFMLDEELRGWFVQLKEYQRRGLQVNLEGTAKILAGYRNFAGRMIDYEDALTWVRDVLAGRWQPTE
jgi:hypothetical protein